MAVAYAETLLGTSENALPASGWSVLALTSRSGARTPLNPIWVSALEASRASRAASDVEWRSAALSNGGRFGNAEKSPPSCGATMNGGVWVRGSEVVFETPAASVEI